MSAGAPSAAKLRGDRPSAFEVCTGGVPGVPELAEIVGLRRRTGAILNVMVAADIPDGINRIVEFRNLLSPQRLTDVVDVGANPIEGEPPYTPMLAAGLCRVTGFEPQEEALLELQTKKGPNERYLPYAVGDGDAHTLNICRASGMTSLLEPDPATLGLFEGFKRWGEVIGRVPLQTRRLDDISEIQHLDFLKIDIQGGELAVLKGGKAKLTEAVAVQTEISFVTLYKNQPGLEKSTWSCAARGSFRTASPRSSYGRSPPV